MSARVSDHYRTAFVTGASTGLGRAFAEMLLADGVKVWGTARDRVRLSDLSQRHDSQFHAVELDLSNGSSAEKVLRTADAAAGGFDLMINNAGFGVFGEFARIDFVTWQEQLEVMLIQPVRLSH